MTVSTIFKTTYPLFPIEKSLDYIVANFNDQLRQIVSFDLYSGISFNFPNKPALELQLEKVFFQIKSNPKAQAILESNTIF